MSKDEMLKYIHTHHPAHTQVPVELCQVSHAHNEEENHIAKALAHICGSNEKQRLPLNVERAERMVCIRHSTAVMVSHGDLSSIARPSPS